MDAARHTVLVAFDIEGDARRRNRIARELLNHGYRVQRSVFECRLSQEDERRLRRRLERCITASDSLRFWRLPNAHRVRSIGLPQQALTWDTAFVLV